MDPGPGVPVSIDRTNPKYGHMINATGLQKIDDDYHKRKSYLYNYRSNYGQKSNSLFFGNFGQSIREENESVEIDPNNFTPDDHEPEFKNKIEEDIWRLKNRK